ncbi:MAG: thioredoxin [Micavibrio aeruginosavorus]|uniref:Thioredoxin n=1 Tax=Micavibrio aeruginosavorus TaxID=349221 RepID=A0A2W5N3Z6_9BACT|nr:MAG: thioredoxin [Micavibrio aeruginosavorus]
MALFGIGQPKKETTPSTLPEGPIFDVSSAAFEEHVLKASMDKPVLVDFWAPWCGPCKQLMPVLEAEVNAANGEVLLAKVNIDENPDLAQALRIQSVPTVMAFFQGQPVTAFTGARPASDIKNLIVQLVKMARGAKPDAIDIPAALKEAAQFIANGDPATAQQIYIQILQQDEMNAEAYTGIVKLVIDAGALEQAQGMLEQAPEIIAKTSAFASAKTALEIAKGAGEALGKLKPLLKKVEAAPNDHQARFELAQAEFAAGQKAGAIDNLLTIVRTDRTWNDEAARKELLRYFEAMGFADPLSIEGRKKLSRLLFS